ncbi:hypothetical protein KFE25_007163 [Diacronema lutheri]|uniref:J domain-containing protein n=2 Tax=Diacronema lutheri TaxID=2081491 RepID=A0A8J6CEG9_DIALT|nr:hypothetical protein KFE25_007163 [Diacronema lutheri]
MEANRDEAELVLARARDVMRSEPRSQRAMELLRKAERMHPSDEVRKAIADWQAICDVFAQRDDARALLGALTATSEAELKAARKKLSLRVHPDKNSAPGAAEAFQIVQAAFELAQSAVVGGVLRPDVPLVAQRPAQEQHQTHAAQQPAPPMPPAWQAKIEIICAFCGGRLDVVVPPPAICSLPLASPVAFTPFAARCCFCDSVVHVQSRRATSAGAYSSIGHAQGSDVHAAQQQHAAARQKAQTETRTHAQAGAAGMRGSGMARRGVRRGSGAVGGGGARRGNGGAAGANASHAPLPVRSAEQKQRERAGNLERVRELERESAQLRDAAMRPHERTHAGGDAAGGAGVGGGDDPGGGLACCRGDVPGNGQFVDLEADCADSAAAEAADAKRMHVALRRKRRREERHRSEQPDGGGEHRAASGAQRLAVVIDLELSEDERVPASAEQLFAPQRSPPPTHQQQLRQPQRAQPTQFAPSGSPIRI